MLLENLDFFTEHTKDKVYIETFIDILNFHDVTYQFLNGGTHKWSHYSTLGNPYFVSEMFVWPLLSEADHIGIVGPMTDIQLNVYSVTHYTYFRKIL